MAPPQPLPPVTVFGPDPLLSIAIEQRGDADEIHLHAAGQGVWVAKMAAEMGANPTLCGFLGGETGAILAPLLGAMPGERRLARTLGASGSYVYDRRHGGRELMAAALRPAPERHEVDDLVAATCVAALDSAVLVVCNPYPAEGFPGEAYETIVADVRGAGIPVIADLSSPRLERILPYRPELVKLNDWELAQYVCGPVDGRRGVEAAIRLQAAGAQAVAVTRAQAPILVLAPGGEAFEVVPPPLSRGFREGCGDAMTGAIAAAWARGLPLREALVLGAAAGSGNFLRRGLGSGRREVIEDLTRHIEVHPLTQAPAAA